MNSSYEKYANTKTVNSIEFNFSVCIIHYDTVSCIVFSENNPHSFLLQVSKKEFLCIIANEFKLFGIHFCIIELFKFEQR